MATPRILSRDEAIRIVRDYKQVIAPRFNNKLKVMLYGSYAKGSPHAWSDIDVAVIVPKISNDQWLAQSAELVHESHQMNSLIEPVLMEDNEDSILYSDVMRTGIAV